MPFSWCETPLVGPEIPMQVTCAFRELNEYPRQNMGLVVRSSAIHGSGCFTTTPIQKGERVAEYTGRRISKDEADTLYENSSITYLFGLGDGTVVIDGDCTAKFMNHSCDGNCETIEEDDRIWIVAIRDVPPETELTYDYCLYDGGDDPCTCSCGAENCRGSMYSPAEIKRRKAAAKRAKAMAKLNKNRA